MAETIRNSCKILKKSEIKYVFWSVEFPPTFAILKSLLTSNQIVYLRGLIPVQRLIRVYEVFFVFHLFVKLYIKNIVKKSGVMTEDNIVFVYTNPWTEFLQRSHILSWIKKTYPNSMHVVWFLDITIAKKMDIDFLKSVYDELYVYDEVEAANMQIRFSEASYSKNYETPSHTNEIYDVTYVGQAKDRLNEIHDVYKRLSELGLKCKFFIVNANDEEKINGEGLLYSDHFLTEEEYFNEYISKSKCLLEISNPGTWAITARVREAILYEKKLLTNNLSIKNFKYYNSENIMAYTSVNEINQHFFTSPACDYGYEGEYEPLKFLDELYVEYCKRL